MNGRLVVDERNQLRESGEPEPGQQPAGIKLVANIISYIFHPVFVPLYLVLFMVYIHPYLFVGFTPFDKTRTAMMAVMMFTFFPVVTVLLLKALKFIDTFHLTTQKDRVIPLVACGVWYFWIWYVWWNLPEYPTAAIQMALAIWISVSLGLMANIIMKVSLHAISMGVMITFISLLGFTQEINSGIYISIAFLIAGLVCTSRFIISDHTQKEVYGGLTVGIISQLIAWWVA